MAKYVFRRPRFYGRVKPLSVVLRQAMATGDTTILCSLGQVEVSGLHATIQADIDTNILCTLGQVEISGLAAEIRTGEDTTIYCTLGQVNVSGLQATIQADIDTTIFCSLGQVEITGLKAQITTGEPTARYGTGESRYDAQQHEAAFRKRMGGRRKEDAEVATMLLLMDETPELVNA